MGILVSERGFEPNSKKIQVILDIQSSRRGNEVQKLTCCIVTLIRLVSRSTSKYLPFYNILRGSKNFVRTSECEKAFLKLKEHLGHIPILAKPLLGEKLFLYLIVFKRAVSSVYVKNKFGV